MDTTKIDSDLVSKLIELSQDDAITSRPEGVEELYEEFLSKFPKNKITELTQEQYCLGHGSITDNYCRWIERGLQPIFGRYMPGTAKGHLLYLKKDGTLYKHQSLSDLSDDDALSYVLKIHQIIIDADVNADITWIDQDNEVYDRAGVEPKCVMGAGRRARLISIYNPDTILPISSTDHIEHFLKAFDVPESRIPPYNQVIRRLLMLTDIYQTIKKEHDLDITPHEFMSVLYSEQLGIKPSRISIYNDTNEELDELTISMFDNEALNRIVYGPPGTGKTYCTTELAVQCAAPDWYCDFNNDPLDESGRRERLKAKYDELTDKGRIAFTTFHQSFSYEDFVEGIRPIVVEGIDGSSNISYEVVDGIFKQLCTNARTTEQTGYTQAVNIEGKNIWKLSLGNTNISDENEIFNECIDNNYVLLGWGDDIDFSNCSNRREVVAKIEQSHNISLADDPNNYKATAVNTFKNAVSIGDLVIISDGNHKFRAIAEITSDYEFLDTKERSGFQQLRKVKWLRIYSPSLPKERLFDKSLSQMTIYQLRNTTINREKLKQLLTPEPTTNSSKLPHLIIIDEINRGNISRIFGELITLLESDKRKGGSDAREVTLPYSKLPFSVPSNLYVLGTMNTADKSLAQLDLALRRRFDFIELLPKPELLDGITVHGIAVSEILTVINQRIEVLLDREHTIGHSYFWSLKDLDSDEEKEKELGNIFKRRIIPLLQEYFFSDWERIGWVLNDPSKHTSEQFVQTGKITPTVSELFHSSIKGLNDRRYLINETAFNNPESYKKILIQLKSKSSDGEA
ncbi:AAA family ATPase [Psychrobacter sp. NPDC077938]|uniref:AAA family ATPase n=1 Tax=Psychrobacter sp. NPDC077938 TaxID=3364494 RepID=UPI0037C76E43